MVAGELVPDVGTAAERPDVVDEVDAGEVVPDVGTAAMRQDVVQPLAQAEGGSAGPPDIAVAAVVG